MLPPLNIVHLLPRIDDLFIDLLESLSPDDWDRQTLAPRWKVKDVAAHLLDGNLRTLSMLRDGYFGESPEDPDSYEGMVRFLDGLNADWEKAMKRLSPRVIIDLLRISGKEYCDYLSSLDPQAPAVFTVDWAGEEESKNWFHIAREYTEKWHHQQQIRLAVNQQDELLKDEWYRPFMDTSIRALPHHYRDLHAEEGDLIQFTILGESEMNYFLEYGSGWQLMESANQEPACTVRIPGEDAWKVFTKGMKREEAISRATISGKEELGLKIFEMITIMG